MNQRDSSGLPLRAMVMVLLFLGVVFLLVALQAMGSDSDEDDAPPLATTTTTTTPTTSEAPKPADAEVRVFNISTVAGAAEGTAGRLREAGFNVTETGNLELPDVPATTVYFSDAPGEQEAAEEVGRLLEAPVEPRLPALAEQPPGVIVVVTG
ncbi:LytR C-terminal domain-containing protein [Mycolicibacterium novocastrense]|uniref:LytR C-terminal domain-containing protein n=1 Tax=Mycolicibacterium novocastrense TaxID=59813 RepID=A0AAW5SRB1_MYCNV|nr:LytR C-terminal domain-containing protein [Mycolicibacterium novocastrense]MCV7026389.1 LytR C-terminal domain-containing protein [Mycolicibacterium novocastrense]GAT11226.1 tuberculin-like peptide [Mycolicibacterium novocastrense]